MSAADRLAWREGSRTCDGCGIRAPGKQPDGWEILPAASLHTRTGERATCPSCQRHRPIKMGQIYASTDAADRRNRVRQRRCVVGVDWCSYLVWLRTDDAIVVSRPAVVPMSGRGPDSQRYIPDHRLVA